MSFGFQGFESDSQLSNDNSISRYFGSTNRTENKSNIGLDFNSILADELNLDNPIDQKLDITLQRLENNQPLINVSPEQAAESIFKAVEKITSGIYQVFNSKLGSPTPAMSETDAALDRLLTGAKQLFDRFEIPFILEELGEVWKKLKKQKSPDFHSVHSYLLHIGISFLSLNSDSSNTIESDYEKVSYKEDTYYFLANIIESLPDCSEKNELVNLINLAEEYNPDELSWDDAGESSNDEYYEI